MQYIIVRKKQISNGSFQDVTVQKYNFNLTAAKGLRSPLSVLCSHFVKSLLTLNQSIKMLPIQYYVQIMVGIFKYGLSQSCRLIT